MALIQLPWNPCFPTISLVYYYSLPLCGSSADAWLASTFCSILMCKDGTCRSYTFESKCYLTFPSYGVFHDPSNCPGLKTFSRNTCKDRAFLPCDSWCALLSLFFRKIVYRSIDRLESPRTHAHVWGGGPTTPIFWKSCSTRLLYTWSSIRSATASASLGVA